MKCDELKRFDIVGKYRDEETMYEFSPDGVCYDADDVDSAIAELKQKLDEKDMEIESLKASHYAEMVDAGMENNILKRALWLTRALRARDIQRWWLQVTCSPRTEIACRKWNNVERKCRAKAEQYK